ncbi:MAG TPA: hypothetical protein VN930_04055, partial [Xanthobacteraceae bacterium]|nr:hypothetical protein [Xanthobacteraceae bacterium]
ISIATGSSYGVLVYIFGANAQPFTLLQMNVVMLMYFLTIFHLRHTHVWLPVRGALAYIIQSPAHHQIHHSVEATRRQESGILPVAMGLDFRHPLHPRA